jgi:hypothetical protein
MNIHTNTNMHTANILPLTVAHVSEHLASLRDAIEDHLLCTVSNIYT